MKLLSPRQCYEPIRPLRAPDNGQAYYVDAMQSIGVPRVDYGRYGWPSRSYWLVPITTGE